MKLFLLSGNVSTFVGIFQSVHIFLSGLCMKGQSDKMGKLCLTYLVTPPFLMGVRMVSEFEPGHVHFVALVL
jgi:hypothetical protein